MTDAVDIFRSKVLVVDDQEPNVTLLVRMLLGAGYTQVSSTMDSREVHALHKVNHYDLILLDLQMPHMDGFEVLESLKELETDGYLSVLVVTAQPAHKLRALKCGARDFVSKPFDVAEVLMRVHNMLEVRLLHDAARTSSKTQESLALHDPLTGLANRRLLAERVRSAVSHGQANDSGMAVLYLDLDGFKAVNDRLGHGGGDQLLKLVAERLAGSVGEEDTVARLGGDEFMIALRQVASPTDAAMIAAKVIAAVAEPCEIDGEVVRLTASAGVSVFPANGADADALMAGADLALHEAKHAGKNAYRMAKGAGEEAADVRKQRVKSRRTGMQAEDFARLSMTEIIRVQTELSQQLKQRFEKHLALAFSDMVGSTPYFQKYGDAAGRQLQQRHFDLLAASLPAEEGRLVDTAGDGAFVIFPSVDQAIEALTAFRRAAAAQNASSSIENQLEVRVGIHWGTVLTDGVGVTGDAVNLCARVAGSATAGEIRITDSAFHEFRTLAHRVSARPLGAVELKGSNRPMELLIYEWRDTGRFPTHVRIEEMNQDIELPELDAITFGRLSEAGGGVGANNIVVAHPDADLAMRISRWHFELRRHPDGFHLRPLSEQPTEVDGKLLAKGDEVVIRPGSIVRIAKVVTLSFYTPARAGEASGDDTMCGLVPGVTGVEPPGDGDDPKTRPATPT